MKILLICNKSPFPAADGGAIAMGSMVRSMALNGYDTRVLNMISYKHRSTANDWPRDLKEKVTLHFAGVDLRLKPSRAFLNLFSSRSYHAERFFSKEVADKIIAILKAGDVDVVHMETVFPMVYHDIIREHSKARIILRLHNVEHEVWETAAKAEKNPVKKWYLTLLANRLKIFELDAFKKADGIITISSADYEKVKSLQIVAPVANIPLGVDLPKYPLPPLPPASPPALFHLGAMDWIPNQQGMSWFIETAWKTLREKYPDLHFFIAGRKMPQNFFELRDDRLHVKGEVDDALQFMQSKDIMVVPVLSGGGIRVKIIEGMALGKAVVTTPLGAAGIDCSDGENIFIGNTPEELVQKISLCIDDTNTCTRVGKNARKLVEEKYSLTVTSVQLDSFLSVFR